MPTYSLSSAVQAEIEIRKSRFIAFAIPVADRDAAMAQISLLREQHSAATHVCWALLAGGHSGMSDDGEPSGTAGRPILEVLRHHELDGVLAAVVRHYGGIKLGAGGLMRAYTDAIAAALKLAERIEYVAHAELVVDVDYADEARVRRWLEQQQHQLVGASHGDAVQLAIRLPADQYDAARGALRDLTNGRASFPESAES